MKEALLMPKNQQKLKQYQRTKAEKYVNMSLNFDHRGT